MEPARQSDVPHHSIFKFQRICTYAPVLGWQGRPNRSGKLCKGAPRLTGRISTPTSSSSHKEQKDLATFRPLYCLSLLFSCTPSCRTKPAYCGHQIYPSYIKLMSLDNSPPLSNQDKYPEANSTLPECCGCSPGEPTCSSNTTTPPMVPDVSPTMSSISSFVPRPFPPPTLEGVPESYIIHKLHEFAPRYWDKPSTADCTISEYLVCATLLRANSIHLVVPIPHPVGRARRAPDMPLFTPEMPCPAQSQRQDPAGMGRRVTEPILTAVPRVSFKVRIECFNAGSPN